MWIVFGLIAIVATFMNLFLYGIGKDYKLAMAMALSFTALTICADYSMLKPWVQAEDWAALSDVIPGMARAFWFLTVVSIGLNVAPIFLERRKRAN